MEIKFTKEDEQPPSKYLGDGKFICRISKTEQKNSKKGDPMIEAEFTYLDGKTTRDWFMLTGNKFKLRQLALAVGMNVNNPIATEEFFGKMVIVDRKIVGKSVWEGKERDDYHNDYLPMDPSQAPHSSDIPF